MQPPPYTKASRLFRARKQAPYRERKAANLWRVAHETPRITVSIEKRAPSSDGSCETARASATKTTRFEARPVARTTGLDPRSETVRAACSKHQIGAVQ